jgi:hypothetical protein
MLKKNTATMVAAWSDPTVEGPIYLVKADLADNFAPVIIYAKTFGDAIMSNIKVVPE